MSDYFLKGYVGSIPELSTVKGDLPIAKFIIAVNAGMVDRPKKIWIKCIAWRELGVLVKKQIFQGDLVGLNGRVADVEVWIDPKDGKAKGRLVFIASEIAKHEGLKEGFVTIRKEPQMTAQYERLPELGPAQAEVEGICNADG